MKQFRTGELSSGVTSGLLLPCQMENLRDDTFVPEGKDAVPLTAYPLHTNCIGLGGGYGSHPPSRGKAGAAANGGKNLQVCV